MIHYTILYLTPDKQYSFVHYCCCMDEVINYMIRSYERHFGGEVILLEGWYDIRDLIPEIV